MSATSPEDWLLSPRHQRLLPLLIDGKSNQVIASESGLQLHTVETYVSEIFELVGLESQAALISEYWWHALEVERRKGD